MAKPAGIGIDPKSPEFDTLDEASQALAATFPNKDSEAAGMVYKSANGKYRFSTTVAGTDDHFALRAAVPAGVSLAAIVHSHPGKDADGQFISKDDIGTADQLKLPSYVRFLGDNAVRVYRPGVTKTENRPAVGRLYGQRVARGDALSVDKGPSDWDRKLQSNYERNKAYSKQDDYATQLNPQSEAQFRAWLASNKVPFDASAKLSDYDMRGFWLALQAKDPVAASAVNPYDKKIHYPDRWKTPYHESFSAESQWAKPGAPTWNKDDQLVLPSGQLVFDSRKVAAPQPVQPQALTPAVATPAPQEMTPDAPR